jgi:hypothetical protein
LPIATFSIGFNEIVDIGIVLKGVVGTVSKFSKLEFIKILKITK